MSKARTPCDNARCTISVVGRRLGSGLYWELNVAVPRMSGGRAEESFVEGRIIFIFEREKGRTLEEKDGRVMKY